MTPNPRPLLLGFLLVTLLCAAHIDQALISDPGWGVLIAEQWRLGHAPGPRTRVEPAPSDLGKDSASVLSWWPPAYQAVPLAFRELTGLGWGHAIRATVLLCWASALLGFTLYARRVVPAAPGWAWLTLILACCRFTHAPFDAYDGGEALLLGAFPWVLLANVSALSSRSGSPLAALGAGVVTAGLFVVKYSALMSCVALGAAWASLALPRSAARPPRALLRAAAYAAGAAAVMLALRVLGVPGGPTPGDFAATDLHPARALYPFAMLPLALTDLDSLVQFVFAHPSRAWLAPFEKAVIGAPLLFVLLVALAPSFSRERRADLIARPEALAALRCTLALVVVLPSILGVLLAGGATIDDGARHVRPAALAALPWVVAALWQQRSSRAPRARALALAMAMLFIALPCAYGAATLLDKALRRGRSDDPLVGATGVRLPLLGTGADARVFFRSVRGVAEGRASVLYVTAPDLALELADLRLIVRHADFTSVAQLGAERFHGCPVGGVIALLPRPFETSGKGELVRRSFVDVKRWRRVSLAGGSELEGWAGACDP